MSKVTDISKEHLIKLQDTFKTDEAISRLFNCTRQSIFYLRKRHGLPTVKKHIKSRDQKIFEAHNCNISSITIARNFKLSISHVYRIVRNMGEKCKTHQSLINLPLTVTLPLLLKNIMS